MDGRKRKPGSSASFRNARTGLFRASLLLGSLVGALMLITVPGGETHNGLFAANDEGLDTMTTGSIAMRGTAPAGASRGDLGPCIMFPDGTQKGTCR